MIGKDMLYVYKRAKLIKIYNIYISELAWKKCKNGKKFK